MLNKFGGSIWAMSEYGWYPLLLLISTPWFLSQLGTNQYGYWMLLAATTGFGSVLNTGTGAATIKAVSSELGRTQNTAGVESAVRASVAIAIVGGGVLGLLVFSMYWFFGSALLGQMDSTALLRQTGIAAAILIWIEQLDNVLSSAMKGAEQFGEAARIEMLSKTVQVILAACVVWVSQDLSTLYLALVVVATVRLFAKISVVRRIFGEIKLRPSFSGAKNILGFAKWGWLQGVGVVLFGVADRMLVGSLLGAESLTYYSIASQLAMQIHAVAAAGLSVIFPKVSRELEENDAFSLWRVTKLTMAGNLLFSTVLAIVLLVFGPQILILWIGVQAAGPTSVVLPWLVAAYWLLALNVVPYYILLGYGRVRFVGITVLAAGGAGIGAMYITISNIGLIGAPAGRGIYAVLTLALIVPLIRYIRNDGNLVENQGLLSSRKGESLQ
ncbi:MAG: O-antigen/teichoic acid export membrane protein [Gammaproteobacteria bacterium]|jgi:O-antigen/teichoic acid export membrane protein